MAAQLLDGSKGRVLLLMATQTYRASAFLEAASRLDIPVAVGSEQPQPLAHLNPGGHLMVDFHDLEGATDQIVEFAAYRPEPPDEAMVKRAREWKGI